MEVGEMTIYIDVDERTGCGNCEEICPEVFRFNAVTEKGNLYQPIIVGRLSLDNLEYGIFLQ